MQRYAVILVGVVGIFVSPVFGQMGQMANQTPPSMADAIRQQYNSVKGNLLKTADKMPDGAYSSQATPAERRFGGWIGHVADAQTSGCSRALGAPKTGS